jgi:hypothetical protein
MYSEISVTRARTTVPSLLSLFAAILTLAGCSGSGGDEVGAPPTQPATGNRAPTISGAPTTTARVGMSYQFRPTAVDADGDILTYTVTNLPAWASFSAVNGTISGTPQTANIGTYANITVSVSDGIASAALPPFTLQVMAALNSAPTITGTPFTTVAAGNAYAFQPTGADVDGDPLTYVIESMPSWAAFNTANGRLSGTPGAANVGTYARIVISVSDGRALTALPAFSITVTASSTNRPPTITGTPPTAITAGNPYLFDPVAADPDGNPLTFSILNKPTWATFNPTTGRLQGTPTAMNVGVVPNITISVSDGSAIASLPAFTLTVIAANGAPVISGVPATTVNVGATYTFTPTASDPDGSPLTFSILNMPSWATFNVTNGRLQGAPTSANVGTFGNITIRVSDGVATTSLTPFSITVTQNNTAPTISGTPSSSGVAGTLYTFTPTAADAESNPLTFSILNMPSWATFSTTTGRLQGTPALTNLGAFANITIRVSDGTTTTSLPTFTITVTQVGQGEAAVSWTAPTQTTEGTALTDLAGFRVNYGTSPGSMTQVVQVADPAATSSLIGQLNSGTYYFAVTAYDSSNADSAMSNPVSKVVP